jgi:hypothetical protein
VDPEEFRAEMKEVARRRRRAWVPSRADARLRKGFLKVAVDRELARAA